MFNLFRRNKALDNDALSGTWEGKYIYGSQYVNLHGIEVGFTIKLHVKRGRVKGICIDDETKHLFSKPASIKGTFKKATLEFVKTYPCYTGLDEKGQQQVYPDRSSLYIYYYGKLNDSQFEGPWAIPETYVDESGQQQSEISKGTWYMRKTS